MSKIQSPLLLVQLLLLFILFGCSPTRPEVITVDPGFRDYVSGYTSGMIHRKGTIRIELAQDVDELKELPEKELNELFSIEPKVDGKLIAVTDRVLEFVPEKPLAVNQFYTAELEIDELMDVKSGFEDFVFQFSTFSQKMNVDISGLQNYNRYDLEHQFLEGKINTTDFEDTALLVNTLKFEIDGKELPFRLKDHYSENTWRFVVDSIRRRKDAQKLIVSWDGKSIQSFSKGTDTVNVAGLSDFSVTSVNVRDGNDQSVQVVFSEPIKTTQNLNGIIQIDGADQLKYKVNYNKVTVYLTNRISGKHKIKVNRGINNFAGFAMHESFTKELFFQEALPRVRLNGSGSILPNSQGLIFPFEAIALKAVDVRVIRIYERNVHHFLQVNDLDGNDELTRFGKIIAEKRLDLTKDKKKNLKQWNTHVINLERLIKPQPGAIYQVAIKFKKPYALCDCDDDDDDEEKKDEDLGDKVYELNNENWNEHQWHTYGFDGYSTWSYYDEGEDPCDEGYYYGRAVKRNILASNIGMIFKLDEDKTAHTIVSDMISTTPVSGAQISFYDYTNELIVTMNSDSKGMAKVKLKRKPFLMIARKGKQRGYLKLGDGRTNSLSKFDVGGEVVQKGVKGYIYAERGVWRPGDSLYIQFILQDELKTLPKNHPVNFKFFDPSGNAIYEVNKTKNLNGVYDFRTATSQGSPTGNYRAEVSIGNKTYEKRFKVETIKPNRLKINLETKTGTTKDSCILNAKWLHGASAKNLKANVKVGLIPMRTAFKKYPGYTFDSPIRPSSSQLKTIFEGKLDEEGNAQFHSHIDNLEEVSGMLQANYVTKVYEKGGDFSVDRQVSTYSPFNTYIGIRSPKASIYDETLETDQQHVFKLAAVQKSGKPAGKTEINVRIYKLDWDWWFDASDYELAKFTARSSATLVKEFNTSTNNGYAQFKFGLDYPEYGRFLILATDKNGNHQAGKVVHIDWPYWSRSNRSDNEFAKMLTFATDKKNYQKGESIKLSFPSPSKGRALISVETSQKVVKKFWVETQQGETHFSFTATADMAPNAYLHVTLLQPHHATKNDLPIRMYGVLPVSVDDPNTHLHPVIRMKDKIRPESTTSITVREQQGKKMTYTLAIVDDGLLDLTHFKTPQPWNTFYSKEALGVKTWDVYDDVIGAYSGKLDNLLTIGGDAAAIVGNGPKANRFKPMVKFLGPFVLPAGGSKTHKVKIPNYVGSVRVMVVARNGRSYGNTQKTVKVKKPLMVLATAPRVLGPGETFALPVNIFAMEKHIKNVSVSVETNGILQLKSSNKQSVQFEKVGDEVVNFNLLVKEKIGLAKIKVRVQSGNEVSTQEIELDVRASNPVQYDIEEFFLEPGKSVTASLNMNGFEGTNLGTVEMSVVPGLGLDKRMGELINYPHGCVEQTTSSVFPQLFLSSLTELDSKTKKSISKNIKAAIKRLQRFQTSDGGLSYWPGGYHENEWGTNYAGHFLLEAEALGYSIPSGMKSKWIRFQKNKAINWSNQYASRKYNGNQLTQAYRLYLLALAEKPEIGAMNRLREEQELSNTARWRLASAYSLIGQPEAAKKLMKGTKTNVNNYTELSGTFGSGTRDKAIILECLATLNRKDIGLPVAKELAKTLRSERWMSTQETAYSLLAMAKFYAVNNANPSAMLQVKVDQGSTKNVQIAAQMKKVVIHENGTTKRKTTIKNTGKQAVYISVITEKVPKKGTTRPESKGLSIQAGYTDLDGQSIDVKELKQGTEFVAMVTLHNPSKKHYEEMALSQLFPSGWEIHNHRMLGGEEYSNNKMDYQDIRDDRIYSYYYLKPGESKTVKVLLNATYQGKYYLPAIYSEAMYDHNIRALVPGKWVTVKPE